MDKRLKILQAAEQLLAERGFYGLSMKVLASKAGIAAGTIYRYFENKEMLMVELHQYISSAAAQTTFEGWSDQLTEKQKYELMWNNIFNAVLKSPQRLAVMEMLYCMPHINQRNTELLETDSFFPLMNFFKQGVDDKRFQPWPIPALLAMSIDTSINLAKQVLRERFQVDQKILTEIRNASWQVIQTTT